MSSGRGLVGSHKETGKSKLTSSINRPNSAGAVNSRNSSPSSKTRRKGSPIMHKLAALFRRNPDHEEGVVPVRPSCFDDDRYQRRSESPEAVDGKRRNSGSSGKQFKIRKSGGGKEKPTPRMWRPKGRLEWESDSGRQLTLTDVSVNDLSKVEIQTLQRLSIPKLQAMEIPASHGLLKSGSRNMSQRLSFNTLKQRKVNVGDKSEMEQPSVIFGQPLQKLLPQDQIKNHSGSSTPVPSPQPRNLTVNGAASVSPTSTSSDASYLDVEPNPTSLLLEALDAMPPSPKAQRRMSLCPADPQVPDIVRKAIHYLDTKGVKTEGIFRIPGAKTRIDEIRVKFDSGEDVELTDDINPHDVACLLKEFFRSLPEPLLTRDLYQPFLTTQKLSTPASHRDALRYLCLLLPQANRDTLQELLRFLTRVALRSNGIILIDGTEESGNLMTERNLAMIIGPNILHKELKRKNQKGEYQVQKQDAEELSAVCKVVEDLIQMQTSIFMIPAKMYDECLKDIMTTDPDALDQLLKRKCYEQGLYLESPDMGLTVRSRSSEALRKISLTGNSLETSSLAMEPEGVWQQRRRSLSDTQKVLDEAIKNLEKTLDEEINIAKERHRHFSSTDSAMGESESVVSPIQSEYASSEPSTLVRKRQVYHSMDSAFSNTSSPTNSSEGVNNSDILSMESDSAFNAYGHSHTRMSSGISGISGVSSVSPVPITYSPEPSASPKLRKKDSSLCSSDTSSLPALYSPERSVHSGGRRDQVQSSYMVARSSHTLPPQSSTPTGRSMADSSRNKQSKGKLKRKTLPPPNSTGTYAIQRSPILNSREIKCNSESQLDALSSDHTPTESTSNITNSPSGFSLDSSSHHGHQYVDDGTII